jgi:uracil-DNA glycosylase family 4
VQLVTRHGTSFANSTCVGYAFVQPESFVAALSEASFGAAFNFYRDGDGAKRRCNRLRRYLEARSDAPLLLVGEAPGYRGARVSGIPFTSERQLTGSGPAEATATIVHRTLAGLGLEQEVLLWNVVPAHPHRPGRPDSNRPPTRDEIAAGRPFLTALTAGRRVIAVGCIAGEALGVPWIRHPSRGGASAFANGLLECAVGGRVSAAFLTDEDLERKTG